MVSAPDITLRLRGGGGLTESTDGGAFLYLFSRFLLAGGLAAASAESAPSVGVGDLTPSSPAIHRCCSGVVARGEAVVPRSELVGLG